MKKTIGTTILATTLTLGLFAAETNVANNELTAESTKTEVSQDLENMEENMETTKKQKYTVGGLEVPYSGMEEIKVNGESLNYYFKNIGTIDATDDMVIVTGEKSDKVPHEYIVVGVKVEKVTTNTSTGEKESTWEWQWKAVRNGTFTDKITDATIVGGYYYIVGNYAGQEKGWLAGVSIDTLKDLATSTKINDSQRVIISAGNGGSSSYESTELLWCDTDIKLYAIAGRDTQ